MHRRYGGEDVWILGNLMDHWRSVEDSGVAPRLTPFFLGSTSTQPDDGIGELVSVGHYNCLINSNNQVKHKLSTQGSLLFQR